MNSSIVAGSAHVDCELIKVTSLDKREFLYSILEDVHPGHYDRLYLARFLLYVGYTVHQVCDIISCSAWSDYDRKVTFNQVNSVMKWLNRQDHNPNVNTLSIRGVAQRSHASWINRKAWNKLYNRPMCVLHYISCSECPDSKNNKCLKLAGRGGQ